MWRVDRAESSAAAVSADCQRDAALCTTDPILHQLWGLAYSLRYTFMHAPCRLRVVRIDPLRFLAGCRKRQLIPALSIFFVLVWLFHCIVAYWGYFLCIVSLSCYVFCILVVLIKLSVLANWLARKTRLRKSNHGEGIVSTKPRPKSVYDFLGSVCRFIVLWYMSCLPAIHDIFPTPVSWYSLFVLKVPLNTN